MWPICRQTGHGVCDPLNSRCYGMMNGSFTFFAESRQSSVHHKANGAPARRPLFRMLKASQCSNSEHLSNFYSIRRRHTRTMIIAAVNKAWVIGAYVISTYLVRRILFQIRASVCALEKGNLNTQIDTHYRNNLLRWSRIKKNDFLNLCGKM